MLLTILFSQQVAEDIKAVPINGSEGTKDQLIWSEGKSGGVTVKEAYNHFISKSLGNIPPNLDWKYLWKLKCPQKIKSFLWLFCHNRLSLNESLYREKNW